MSSGPGRGFAQQIRWKPTLDVKIRANNPFLWGAQTKFATPAPRRGWVWAKPAELRNLMFPGVILAYSFDWH